MIMRNPIKQSDNIKVFHTKKVYVLDFFVFIGNCVEKNIKCRKSYCGLIFYTHANQCCTIVNHKT